MAFGSSEVGMVISGNARPATVSSINRNVRSDNMSDNSDSSLLNYTKVNFYKKFNK